MVGLVTSNLPEPQDDDSRRAGKLGGEQRNGKDESGQMSLFDFVESDSNHNDSSCANKSKLAEIRAYEAMEFFTLNPEAYPAVKRYASECARKGESIKSHQMVTAMKNEDHTGFMAINNNHVPFIRRLLVADDEMLAANMEFRGSMYDALDIGHYLSMLRNQQASLN